MHVELERSRQTWGGRDIREHVVMEEERRELGDDRPRSRKRRENI